MINFLLIVYFHGTKSYQSIFLFLNSASNTSFTRGGIETMRKYLETSSDKSILSNSMCDLAKIILKNNYFGNG